MSNERKDRTMSKRGFSIISISVSAMAALFAPLLLAQRGGDRGMPKYDPATEITVKGTVEDVSEHEHGGWTGTHLKVKTEKEMLEVHLGPTSFLKEKGFLFSKGDQTELVGSRVKYEGADAVVAREVKKDGKSLELRNAKGIPKWSRGRRR